MSDEPTGRGDQADELDSVELELKGLLDAADLGEAPGAAQRLVGRVIAGTYELLEALGEGGMGTVYLAEHQRTGGRVAVKLIKPSRVADARALSRFELEARHTASLEHPNIVRVFDFGDDEGLAYLVMEHVPGESLQAILARRGALEPDLAIAVAGQILRALAAAHDSPNQIIHRDIKPANILVAGLDEEPFVKVLDFGIARALEGPATTTQGVIGSPECMAPEQFDGSTVTPATDLYALGCTVYAMLSGRPPFAGSVSQLAFQHCNQEPEPLEPGTGQTIPDDLRRWVAWLMRKDPAERPATARQALEALRDGTAPAPPAAEEVSVRAAVAGVVATVAVLGLVILALASLATRDSVPSSSGSPATPGAAAIAPDADPVPAVQRQEPLNIPPNGSLSHDGERVLYVRGTTFEVMRLDGSDPVVVPAPDGVRLLHAAWMPDGQHVVTTEASGDAFALWKVGLDGSRAKILDNAAFASVAPDGRRLLFKRGIDLSTSHPLGVAKIDGTDARTWVRSTWSYQAFWLSDSETVVYLVRQGSAGVQVGLATEDVSRTLVADAKLATRMASIPDIAPLPGRRLLMARRDGKHSNLWVTRIGDDLTASPPRQVTETDGFSYLSLSSRGTGSKVFYCRGSAQADIAMLEREGGSWKGPTPVPGTQQDEVFFDFSDDGSRYLFGSNREGAFVVYEQRFGTNVPRRVANGTYEWDARYVPGDAQILFWDVHSEGDPRDFWSKPEAWESRMVVATGDAVEPIGDRVFRGPLERKGGETQDFACTPSGCILMLWTTLALEVWGVDIAGRRLVERTSLPAPKTGVTNAFKWALRDDEPRIALLEEGVFGLYSSETGERMGEVASATAATPAEFRTVADFSWGADGESLLLSQPTGVGTALRRLRLDGTSETILNIPRLMAMGVAESPDGDRIVWTQAEWECPTWLLEFDFAVAPAKAGGPTLP